MAMVDNYGSIPSDIIAQIGPGISLDSFEVGDEVYDNFAKAGFDMSTISLLNRLLGLLVMVASTVGLFYTLFR